MAGIAVAVVSFVLWVAGVPINCPDYPEPVVDAVGGRAARITIRQLEDRLLFATDDVIHTGGGPGSYSVCAILRMTKYDAYIEQSYADSTEAYRVYQLLANSGMGHDQKFDHGGRVFRGYDIRGVQFNPPKPANTPDEKDCCKKCWKKVREG